MTSDIDSEDPRREYSDHAFIEAVRHHQPTGTAEVAQHVGITRQGATRRLKQLEQQGVMDSKKIGKTLVWTIQSDDQQASVQAVALGHRAVANRYESFTDEEKGAWREHAAPDPTE